MLTLLRWRLNILSRLWSRPSQNFHLDADKFWWTTAKDKPRWLLYDYMLHQSFVKTTLGCIWDQVDSVFIQLKQIVFTLKSGYSRMIAIPLKYGLQKHRNSPTKLKHPLKKWFRVISQYLHGIDVDNRALIVYLKIKKGKTRICTLLD